MRIAKKAEVIFDRDHGKENEGYFVRLYIADVDETTLDIVPPDLGDCETDAERIALALEWEDVETAEAWMAAHENAEDDTEIDDAFFTVYGRYPDAEDREAGVYSLVCSALID
jgi:hypothetical protein